MALAAGILTAVSLPLVFWGQDARGYAAMAALVAGSFAAFAELVDGPRRRGPWIAYVVLTTLSVYASYVAIFALAAQLLALALAPAGVAARAQRDGGVRDLLDPAGGAGGESRIGPAVLDPAPDLKADKQVILALTSAGFEPNFRPTAVAGGAGDRHRGAAARGGRAHRPRPGRPVGLAAGAVLARRAGRR